MAKIFFYFFILITFCTTTVWAKAKTARNPVISITLSQAQEIALKYYSETENNNLQIKNLDFDDQNNLPKIIKNVAQVSAGDATRIKSNGKDIKDPVVIDQASTGISAKLTLTDFGQRSKKLESQEATLTAEQENLRHQREKIILNVSTAYLNALRAKALININKNNIQAKKNLSYNMKLLAKMIGYKEDQPFFLTEVLPPPLPKTNPEDFISQALKENSQLQSVESNAEAAKKNYEAVKAENYPTLNAILYTGKVSVHEVGKINDSYSAAGINLKIPIFTGGSIIDKNRKAKLKAKSYSREVAANQKIIIHNVEEAYHKVQTTYQNMALSQNILAHTRSNKTNAKINNINATYDYIIALANLRSIVGAGVE